MDELDRLMMIPEKDRRNYVHIVKRCQNCDDCTVGEKGKHIISFKCKLDDKFISLMGFCDEWKENK